LGLGAVRIPDERLPARHAVDGRLATDKLAESDIEKRRVERVGGPVGPARVERTGFPAALGGGGEEHDAAGARLLERDRRCAITDPFTLLRAAAETHHDLRRRRA